MPHSDNEAGLTQAALTDLRSYGPLLEALGDGDSPGDATEQIRTPLTAPDPDDIPPALLIIDVQAVASADRGGAVLVDYEVEAGLTVTAGWIEGNRPGPNPEIAFSRILDAVSERANVGFGVDHLALSDAGTGGGSGVLESPMEAGEKGAARLWQFEQSRN
ncbi:hypothetical protein HTZ84_05185 [Haloterrigena sp. SYSU A558-1]|uniref:Uncharacterized protein n=1 Tax=Haloterrigena gelatinilytica TaxID=2741724 RepID=A0ABX2L655_9EURY|nr:hypothetical protein [Haloterrigena gelatinilytica]NUC71707.1 hypothetical protein [Haloterrigena gelatinilytica]